MSAAASAAAAVHERLCTHLGIGSGWGSGLAVAAHLGLSPASYSKQRSGRGMSEGGHYMGGLELAHMRAAANGWWLVIGPDSVVTVHEWVGTQASGPTGR